MKQPATWSGSSLAAGRGFLGAPPRRRRLSAACITSSRPLHFSRDDQVPRS